MTPEECAAEAVRRLKEADSLFDDEVAARAAAHGTDGIGDGTHVKVCHLRQTAAVYATLALASRGVLQGIQA